MLDREGKIAPNDPVASMAQKINPEPIISSEVELIDQS